MTKELLLCFRPGEDEELNGGKLFQAFLQSRVEEMDATLRNSEIEHAKEVKHLVNTSSLMKESSSRLETEISELRTELERVTLQRNELLQKEEKLEFSLQAVVNELSGVLEGTTGVLCVSRSDATSTSIEAMVASLDRNTAIVERLVENHPVYTHE